MSIVTEPLAGRAVEGDLQEFGDGCQSTLAGGTPWWRGPWSWPVVTWLAIIHVGALFAPFFIS